MAVNEGASVQPLGQPYRSLCCHASVKGSRAQWGKLRPFVQSTGTCGAPRCVPICLPGAGRTTLTGKRVRRLWGVHVVPTLLGSGEPIAKARISPSSSKMYPSDPISLYS